MSTIVTTLVLASAFVVTIRVVMWVYDRIKEWREEFVPEDPLISELKARLQTVVSPEIIQGLTFKSSNESYTVNKRHVHLCLRNQESGKPYPINMLMYVALHEIAHVMCPEIGHTPLFHTTFNELLKDDAGHPLFERVLIPRCNGFSTDF
jgi:predicted metal-dependent hydrolase